MTKKQLEAYVRSAYKNVAKKLKTQGDRVLVRGENGGVTVEMWINTSTNMIETAYPVFK